MRDDAFRTWESPTSSITCRVGRVDRNEPEFVLLNRNQVASNFESSVSFVLALIIRSYLLPLAILTVQDGCGKKTTVLITTS